jgi:hypothetical protein
MRALEDGSLHCIVGVSWEYALYNATIESTAQWNLRRALRRRYKNFLHQLYDGRNQANDRPSRKPLSC